MSDLPDTYLLLPASKRPQTRAQLMKALVPRVKTLLTEVCLWDDEWEVGDYRFGVISYDLPGDVHVFFQFWSEPDDAAMWEIRLASGIRRPNRTLPGRVQPASRQPASRWAARPRTTRRRSKCATRAT